MSWDMGLTLQNLLIAVGGGAVPLAIYLFSRRAQIRQLDSVADVNITTAATALVASLQNQVKILEDKIRTLESERSDDRANFVTQLNRAHNENNRISMMVAQAQTELDITRRQIEELKAGHKRLQMAIEDSSSARAAMTEGAAEIITVAERVNPSS